MILFLCIIIIILLYLFTKFGLFYNLLFDFYKIHNNLLAYDVLLTVSFSIMITNSLTSYFLPFLIIASREMWLITKSKINVLKL